MSNIKAFQLRSLKKKELLDKLEEYKKELSGLRISKAIGNSAKNSKIHSVRKNVARVLTVYNQKRKMELRKLYKNKKFKPYNLKNKLTKKKRLELTKKQKSAMSLRTKKRLTNFPKRKYLLVKKN
ncbi:60S ribosomal protein L35, putative [Plasmodium vinckei]|uniref:60S ribosomal protein L35, putative n=5 Tax=Plasmodium (Vinckeia) TaxID=418101 RepID=A0A077XET8_PLACU|nr:60S ribosomal protein L35, putative [Plasmodium chabaudi chabaudi]CAD2091697.1 60S ribosomal protein L35, putative [Plasmodium vinckei lentum]CAD2104169.1 60S ribosomal protein L35, putative [Plasmodium vinckei]CAD2104242.1 60S ribosomal protein L35, putative [Plasmodium vinckei petteri]SCM21096.1 60S ribosomal protein L35, putative [Plasmodium chabaudi adami]SCM22162.1 60S ribosomal protein L35, putative [Plasmodium chabaudi chabaudi]|eukprot:XP_016655383.1 60S ribosomal protein L35, putative [Plasmodium chabaudi chabaudi]